MSNVTIEFSEGTEDALSEIGIDGEAEVRLAVTNSMIADIKYLIDNGKLDQAEIMLSSLIEFEKERT